MTFHLIDIRHESGERITHALDAGDQRTLCGHGIDWRYDDLVGRVTSDVLPACPTCRERINESG